MLVSGEGLQRGPVDVLGTLLHEAAHGLAQARSIQDTCRGGRYHCRNATLAGELGLEAPAVLGLEVRVRPATSESIAPAWRGRSTLSHGASQR